MSVFLPRISGEGGLSGSREPLRQFRNTLNWV
jgi:hypothetical protein